MKSELLAENNTALQVQSAPIIIELPTFFGMKTVNCFLFKTPEPVLIDCGENTQDNWEALVKGVQANGLELSDIKKVYITHIHLDHYGAAGRLAEEYGTEIWMNEIMEERAFDFYNNDKSIRKVRDITFQKLANYNPNNSENIFEKFLKDQKNNGIRTMVLNAFFPIPKDKCFYYKIGAILNFGNKNWEVIHTPGHSESQVVYYNKEDKSLMSSDMVIKITPAPFFEIKPGTQDIRHKSMQRLMHSYEIVKNLDYNIVYPGHYGIINNPKEVIETQVIHLNKRKDDCLAYIKKGTTDFTTLYFQMFKNFNIAAVAMLIGYIDLLEHEQKVNWIEDETTIKFQEQKS
jgi:glyoxylase-like metal-dependent hydrolase (beta-lactamase superfamily II)